MDEQELPKGALMVKDILESMVSETFLVYPTIVVTCRILKAKLIVLLDSDQSTRTSAKEE